MPVKTQKAYRLECRCALRHNADFGKESEAIVSARQHRPDGQNPIDVANKPDEYGASMAA
jgi:hypothetical protein